MTRKLDWEVIGNSWFAYGKNKTMWKYAISRSDVDRFNLYDHHGIWAAYPTLDQALDEAEKLNGHKPTP